METTETTKEQIKALWPIFLVINILLFIGCGFNLQCMVFGWVMAAVIYFWPRRDLTRLEGFGLGGLIFIILTVGMFGRLLNPHYTLFSNDGPLGYAVSEQWASSIKEGPGAAFWMDDFWIGINGGRIPASFTHTALWIMYNPLWVYRGFLLAGIFGCLWFAYKNIKVKIKGNKNGK